MHIRGTLLPGLAKLLLLAGALLGPGCSGGEGVPASLPDRPAPTTVSRALMYKGRDYLFIRSPRTWYEASTLCASLGSGLVTIDDDAEQAFLRGLEGTGPWWTGANDLRARGVWSWSQGQSTYSHWGPGQPDGSPGDSDCVQDNDAGSGRWNDVSCTTPLPFICESLEDTTPLIIDSSQSAHGVEPEHSVTFEVTAKDPRGLALSFNWSASGGSLATPTTLETTSRVVWTSALGCTPVTVSVEVKSPTGERNSVSFLVTPYNCATCSDGIQNGGELGVDCGGVCGNTCFITDSAPVYSHSSGCFWTYTTGTLEGHDCLYMSGAMPPTAIADFGVPTFVNAFAANAWSSAYGKGGMKDFSIDSSPDKISWTNRYNDTHPSTPATQYYTFEGATERYWRLRITSFYMTLDTSCGSGQFQGFFQFRAR